MSIQALTYQTAVPQLHHDPDGTLHIDIPAAGWKKVIPYRSTLQLVIGSFFVAIGLFGPGIIVYFASHNTLLAACAMVLNVMVFLALLAIMAHFASIRTHVTVTSKELLIETFSTAGPIRHRYNREDIEILAPRLEATGQTRAFGMCVQRHRYDTSDLYFTTCTEEQVRQYTAAIRATLGFPEGEALGKSS